MKNKKEMKKRENLIDSINNKKINDGKEGKIRCFKIINIFDIRDNKEMKNTIANILIFNLLFILIIISSFNVSALGITPGRTTINYEKGLERDISFSILNNEHKEMQVFFMVNGELNSSIIMYDSIVDFNSDEDSKQFRYTIRLSDEISKNPGLHTAEIIALDVPIANSRGTYVGATVAVVSQLFVYAPYPGKYLDADLNILDGEENNTATFIVPVINRGKVGIGEARAIIDIYDIMNRKIASVETDYHSVQSLQRTELSGKWNVSVSSGNYIAKVTLLYDGETRNLEKQFAIGIQSLQIGSILVNNFRLGEVAKLQIMVENKWSQEMKRVYANLLVFDNEQGVMADVRSATESISALSEKELIAYWDTIGVSEGEYNGKLMVKYDEKSADKNLILTVRQDSLDIIGVGFAINPSGRGGITLTKILIAVIILLIIINIAWFVFFRIAMKKRGK